MVELRADKTRQSSSLIPLRKRFRFDTMKSTLNVADNPRSAGSLQFSWDNQRLGPDNRLARLDRMYLSPSLSHSPGRQNLNYTIVGDFSSSDHHHLRVTLQFDDVPKRATH